MRIIYLAVGTIIISLLNCAQSNNPTAGFEGMVEYDISYPNNKKPLGNFSPAKFKILYKEGNIRKEYINRLDSLLMYTIYIKRQNKQFAIYPGTDTIEYYSPNPADQMNQFEGASSNNENELSINKNLLGFDCKYYRVKVNDNFQGADETINYEYWVAKDLSISKIDRSVYGSNFVFPLTGNIILKYSMDAPVTKVVEAKKLMSYSLPNTLFEVDSTGKFLIEL